MSKWNLDSAHSEIGFTVRHMMIAKVRGSFGKYTAEVELPDSGFEGGSVKVSIEAASIDTSQEQRDGHLRSADFFDVEKFPTITFASKRVVPGSGGKLSLVGDLTIHGVTKEVSLSVEHLGSGKDPWGNQRHGFAASVTISRSEFGLTWNQALELGGMLVSDEVAIHAEVQLTPAK